MIYFIKDVPTSAYIEVDKIGGTIKLIPEVSYHLYHIYESIILDFSEWILNSDSVNLMIYLHGLVMMMNMFSSQITSYKCFVVVEQMVFIMG